MWVLLVESLDTLTDKIYRMENFHKDIYLDLISYQHYTIDKADLLRLEIVYITNSGNHHTDFFCVPLTLDSCGNPLAADIYLEIAEMVKRELNNNITVVTNLHVIEVELIFYT